jgi:hypothetical protein
LSQEIRELLNERTGCTPLCHRVRVSAPRRMRLWRTTTTGV